MASLYLKGDALSQIVQPAVHHLVPVQPEPCEKVSRLTIKHSKALAFLDELLQRRLRSPVQSLLEPVLRRHA